MQEITGKYIKGLKEDVGGGRGSRIDEEFLIKENC